MSDAPTTRLTAEESRLRRLVRAIRTMGEDETYPVPAPEDGVMMGHAQFREVGREFLRLLVTVGELRIDDDVLDVGCGGGRMAVPLSYFLHRGTYTGFDVHERSIAWCREHIEPRAPGFRFDHVAVHNHEYNPESPVDAAQHRFGYDDARFDFVLSTSLYTHLLADETANYLSETRRVLRPGGRAFLTAYLLNPGARAALDAGRARQQFPHAHKGAFVRDLAAPAAAVAYDEPAFCEAITRAGLCVDRVAYGTWTGREGLTFQDVLVVRPSG